MNVMFLTNKFITGGAERYILKKAAYLIKSGYGVCVVSAGGEYTEQLKTQGIPSVDVPGLDRNLNLLDSSELLRIVAAVGSAVREHQVDIIEIDSPVVLEIGITAAHQFHLPFLLNLFHEYALKKSRDAGLLESCARHGCFFSLSESIVSITSDNTGADLGKARILPIFIDPEELAGRDDKLDLPDDLFVFLAIARLTKDKAYIGVLMDEYAKFIAKTGAAKTRLLVVGDGEYSRAYQIKAEKINRSVGKNDNSIVMTGSRKDIAAFYRRADVYIGMGTTVLEAAYYQKPVILASFYPNHKASIGYFSRMPYESVGEVIPTRVSFAPFSTLMGEVFTDKKLLQNLAAEGYEKIEKSYLIEPVMKKWIEEYVLLISNKEAILAEDITRFVYKRDNIRIKMRKFQQLLNA